MNQGNKTIAKNTIFLYFRMLFTMIVSLYTSRVILNVLGVEDYGIYQTVGGIVGLLTFLNSALSSGSSRFLTYEMGRKDYDKLKKTFSCILVAHIVLAVIVLLIAETGGLWFIYNKMVVPNARFDAALVVFQFSILASMVTITQVPYTACIIAHERMNIYAYMSIIEVTLKLVIVYLLSICSYDKLIIYSLLYCVVTISVAICYRLYCIKSFSESKFTLVWDRQILSNVLSYSGWNLFANTALALVNQGGIVLINVFFNPSIVAAQSLATQVNMAASQFVNNFRTAFTPQVVKRLASGENESSHSLLLDSTKYSYFLMLMISLPLIYVTEPLLQIWLNEVPEYTSDFLRISIITSLVSVFDTSFYTALYAKGVIRENALISPIFYALVFPATWILYRFGFSPLSLPVVMLVATAIVSLIVKPFLIVRIADYKFLDILNVYKTCILVTLFSFMPSYMSYLFFNQKISNQLLCMAVVIIVSVMFVLISIWYIGLDRSLRYSIVKRIKERNS